MVEVLGYTLPHMSPDYPRYLMGRWTSSIWWRAWPWVWTCSDRVIPTRHARSGMFYTSRGRMRITDARYRRDMYPPDSSCDCCLYYNFSRAYIHHLFKTNEVLGATLTTLHNIHWFCNFMDRMRDSILDGSFEAFREDVHRQYPESPWVPQTKVALKEKGKKRG